MSRPPQVTPEYWARPPRFPAWIRRTWFKLVGFVAGRHAAARVYAEGRLTLAEAERLVAEAKKSQERAEVQNSSLLETVKVRDREILLLQGEKAALVSQLELRVLEVEELNLWLERVRARLNADIASEVAREHGTGRPKPTPNTQAV